MPNYLCFTAEQANSTITIEKMGSPPSVSLEYNLNDTSWQTFTVDSTIVTLSNIGDKVYFRGTNTTFANNAFDSHWFVMTGKIAASGDITTLLNPNGNILDLSSYPAWVFCNLFRNCRSLTVAPSLPSTILTRSCYHGMFQLCSLTTPPQLPATILAEACYDGMFYACRSLTAPPILSATILASGCYLSMFSECNNLAVAPELPATTLANNCYMYMFEGCTSLTAAPELPATSLTWQCYSSMFSGCTSLMSITVAFTDWADTLNATESWVNGVNTVGGTFTAPNELSREYSISRIPINWQPAPPTTKTLTITMGEIELHTSTINSDDSIQALLNQTIISTGSNILATESTYCPYDIVIKKNSSTLVTLATAGRYIPNDIEISIT